MNPAECLKTRPKSVALLGLGMSRLAYGEQICSDYCSNTWDEIWTVNFGGKIYRHDKLWVADDLRKQAKEIPAYGDFLRQHDRPIITTTPYPEFPMSVRFPIEEVLQKLGDDFLNSTVAYCIAWALTTGVKECWLFGCDFHYPNQTRAEEGGQCAAYLLGLGRHFGMTFKIPPSTTLLGAYHAKPVGDSIRRPLYGYAKQPFIPEDGDASRPGESTRVGENTGDRAVPAGQGPPDSLPGAPGRAADLDSRRQTLLRGWGGGQEPAGVVLGGPGQDRPGAPEGAGRPPAWGGAAPGGADGGGSPADEAKAPAFVYPAEARCPTRRPGPA